MFNLFLHISYLILLYNYYFSLKFGKKSEDAFTHRTNKQCQSLVVKKSKSKEWKK